MCCFKSVRLDLISKRIFTLIRTQFDNLPITLIRQKTSFIFYRILNLLFYIFNAQFYIEILPIQRSQFSLSPIEGEGDDFFRFTTTKGWTSSLALFEAVRLPRCRWALKPMWRSEYWPVYLLPFDASLPGMSFLQFRTRSFLSERYHFLRIFSFEMWIVRLSVRRVAVNINNFKCRLIIAHRN